MLLRRITKHVKDQNWFAVGLDFAIVVVGVFIGLQVANWNEARVEQRELAGQLTSLNAEFSENLDRLKAFRSLLDHQINDTSILREVIAGKRPRVDINEVDKSLMNIVSVPIFTIDRTTLDELALGGGLRRLEALGLRELLVEWDETHDELRRVERDAIEQRDANVIPYVLKEVSFGALGEQYIFSEGVIGPSHFHNKLEMFEGNRELDNLVVLRLGLISACRIFVDELITETRAVIQRLEAEGLSP
ncbi:MAG: hypothetical protein AAGJ84_11055 [Pseudomonadota bacterium]